MEQKDNGDWLSAQQAVRPDGTELTNLPLINKKLPPLSAGLPSASAAATTAITAMTAMTAKTATEEVAEAAKASDVSAT